MCYLATVAMVVVSIDMVAMELISIDTVVKGFRKCRLDGFF